MLLLEVNSAMFWVSRSILRQLSPAFKTGKKLQKEAHKISTFIALYCCAAVALIRSMIALVYMKYNFPISVNCVDRHYRQNPDKVALIWEKDEAGSEEYVSYEQLYHMV